MGILEYILNANNSIILSLFVILLVAILVYEKSYKIRTLPGPYGLPIIGYLPFLTKEPHMKFIKLSKKYGHIFRLRLGFTNVVILNDFEAIKEGMTKMELVSKPPNNNVIQLFVPGSPFFVAPRNIWKEHRKFLVTTLKKLVGDKSSFENHITEEIQGMLKAISTKHDKPLDLKDFILFGNLNIVFAIVFGQRFEYGNETGKLLCESFMGVAKLIGSTQLITFFPFLKHFPFVLKLMQFDKCLYNYNQMRKFIKESIKKHKEEFDPSNLKDIMDYYIAEMESKKEENIPTTFSDDIMSEFIIDMIAAGSDTVKVSILWNFYAVAAYPHFQKRIMEEIEDVIGDRVPSVNDMKFMPFTHAFILETSRWKTTIPLGLPRYAEHDTTINGLTIPQGALIIANNWNAHHDPDIWDNPDIFQPERFLTKDEISDDKLGYLIPFSIGKRTCPGETIAHMEVFLYFACILQKYEVTFPENYVPSFEAITGVNYCAKPFKLKLTPKKL